MEKFENLKEFRDLDNLKLINKDKSTEKLTDKFKDLQDIYTLIRTYIKNNNKERIYSQKDEIIYFTFANMLRTIKITEGNINGVVEKINIISNNLKERNLKFNIPNFNEINNFYKRNILEEGGSWVCQTDDKYKLFK